MIVLHVCVCVCVCVCVLGCGVFGVPLAELATSQGDDIPKIVRRVVEHIETHGIYTCTVTATTIYSTD